MSPAPTWMSSSGTSSAWSSSSSSMASAPSSSIPEEFLSPPPQTFGSQLYGGGSRPQSNVVITEEVDIKPVILEPPSPPSHPEHGNVENGEEDDRNDMSEIDILMDELLKDVEVNVAAEPREVAQTKPASLGLSIRKDIFMSPKKEVIELGDSPPKSGIHENPQVAHASSSGSMMITSSAAQIMQSAAQLNQQGISGSMWTSCTQPDSRLQAGRGMIPLRNIAPKPTMSSSQVNFPQHHLQQQHKQQQQQQQQQAPSHLPLTRPNLQQQQA